MSFFMIFSCLNKIDTHFNDFSIHLSLNFHLKIISTKIHQNPMYRATFLFVKCWFGFIPPCSLSFVSLASWFLALPVERAFPDFLSSHGNVITKTKKCQWIIVYISYTNSTTTSYGVRPLVNLFEVFHSESSQWKSGHPTWLSYKMNVIGKKINSTDGCKKSILVNYKIVFYTFIYLFILRNFT